MERKSRDFVIGHPWDYHRCPPSLTIWQCHRDDMDLDRMTLAVLLWNPRRLSLSFPMASNSNMNMPRMRKSISSQTIRWLHQTQIC